MCFLPMYFVCFRYGYNVSPMLLRGGRYLPRVFFLVRLVHSFRHLSLTSTFSLHRPLQFFFGSARNVYLRSSRGPYHWNGSSPFSHP